MKLTYRLFGMRHNTGHTDWHLIRQGLLAILFTVLFFWALDRMVEAIAAVDEVGRLRAKLELREYQLVRCLNGQAVGFVTLRDRTVYTVCRIAEEIEIKS